VLHHGDAVGDRHRLVLIVGNDHEGGWRAAPAGPSARSASPRAACGSSAASGSSRSSTFGRFGERARARARRAGADRRTTDCGFLCARPLELHQRQHLVDTRGDLVFGQPVLPQSERPRLPATVEVRGTARSSGTSCSPAAEYGGTPGQIRAGEQARGPASGRLEARQQPAAAWSCRNRTGPSSAKNSFLENVEAQRVDGDEIAETAW